MKVLSFCNLKGGTSKTTSAVNVASLLPEMTGKRVLLVDADPQANATISMGLDPSGLRYTLSDVLQGGVLLKDAVEQIHIQGLDILPSSIQLASTAEELYAKRWRETILSKAMEPVRRRYGHVILDCNPSLNILTQNAVYVSDRVIIPCSPSRYSLDGIQDLLDLVQDLKRKDPLPFVKILLTQFDKRTTLTNRFVLDQLQTYKGQLLETIIHRCEVLNQSAILQRPVHEVDPKSQGSQDYKQLVKEMLK